MTGQRRYERIEFFCPLRLTVLPDGPVAAANSFDISPGGVGISAPLFLDRGTDVRVDFFLPGESGKQIEENVMGRVAYSRAYEDDNRIGIEFLEPIREPAHPALMKKLKML